MSRLLITGAAGQLGHCLRDLLNLRSDMEPIYIDRDELDLTDSAAVMRYVLDCRPDYIINCAAYTAVDKAESETEAARAVNALAVKYLAESAAAAGCRIIHISTDYVFPGNGCEPLKESDRIDPQNVYGLTKAEGEQMLRQYLPAHHVILRTAWLYSPYGNNFVKTMLRLAKERKEISVVADQIGSPTSAYSLAGAVMRVIDAKEWHPGTYHFTDAGVASWYDLAATAIHMAGHINVYVKPISWHEYPTAAQRPSYSVLSKEKFSQTYNFKFHHWPEALRKVLGIINFNG